MILPCRRSDAHAAAGAARCIWSLMATASPWPPPSPPGKHTRASTPPPRWKRCACPTVRVVRNADPGSWQVTRATAIPPCVLTCAGAASCRSSLRARINAPTRALTGPPIASAMSSSVVSALKENRQLATRAKLAANYTVTRYDPPLFMSLASVRQNLATKLALRAAEMFHQEFNDPGTLKFSDDPLDRDYQVVRTPNGSFMFQGWFRIDYVRGVRTKLGRFKNSIVTDCKTSHMAVGIFVTLIYSSQFDRGTATEKITFLVNPDDNIPDDAVMESYIVESPLL